MKEGDIEGDNSMKKRLYETLKRNDIKSIRKRGNRIEVILK